MPVGERFSLDGDECCSGGVASRPSGTNGQPRLRGRVGGGAHTCVGFALRCRSTDHGRQPGVGGGHRGFITNDAFPPGAEQRVSDFADLIAIAIANVKRERN